MTTINRDRFVEMLTDVLSEYKVSPDDVPNITHDIIEQMEAEFDISLDEEDSYSEDEDEDEDGPEQELF